MKRTALPVPLTSKAAGPRIQGAAAPLPHAASVPPREEQAFASSLDTATPLPIHGTLQLDHNLCFRAAEASPANPLIPDPVRLIGQSVWTIFTGPLRPPLYAAVKKALANDTAAAATGATPTPPPVTNSWTAFCPTHQQIFTFDLSRVPDGFLLDFATPPLDPVSETITDNDQAISVPYTQIGEAIASVSDKDDPAAVFFALSPDIICLLSEDGIIRRVNGAWERVTGHAAHTTVGLSLSAFCHPDERKETRAALTPATQSALSVALTVRCHCADDKWRWLHWNITRHPDQPLLFATARDVTSFKEAEETMRWQAHHDTLTGLPNRALFLERIEAALTAISHQRRGGVAVLFLDLDRFKRINDTLGHAMGDNLLQEVAIRLRASLRADDTVARFGGDEFVALLPSVRDAQEAAAVAHKILDTLSRPYEIAGHDLFITSSIGISVSPADGTTPEALLRNADQAMYRAKSEGRGRVASLRHETATALQPHPASPVEKLVLESRLSQAVERQELTLHYQPQVSLNSGAMIGVEALMRWWQADLGMVPPNTFIPVAEETGLIIPLGSWAVHEACRQAADWLDAGYPLRVAVNLSARQLNDEQFPTRLEKYLQEIGLPARHMDLELTESTFIRNDDRSLETLLRLKALGVHLSVDDFGTGYSSLAYVRNFPIDGVKIDRSFVTNIHLNSADEAVVRAVIDLSHTLGLAVVAEGVEHEAQRDRLHALGCDTMQGFLFSAAVPPADVPPLMTIAPRPY